MSTADRVEGGRGPVERSTRRLVALTGLTGHAEALGLSGRAAAVDRWCAAAADSPPVGSSQWVVMTACFAFLSGFGVEATTMLVAAVSIPDPVRFAGLRWQPLLAVWVVGPPACTTAFLWWLRRNPFARPAGIRPLVDVPLAVVMGLSLYAIGLPFDTVPVSLLGVAVDLPWPSTAGLVAGATAPAAWTGLRCTDGDAVVAAEMAVLAALSIVTVLAVHLLTPLPEAVA